MQVQRTCLVVLRDLRRRVRVLLIISVSVIAFTLWTLRLERWPEVDDSDSERDNFSYRLLSSNATRLSEICTVIAADANPLVANNHRRPTEEDASNMNVPDPLSSGNFIATGHPSRSFRENLRNDTKYITSWTGAGWTNDVMTFANMIYLGIITNRVPIVPNFNKNSIHQRHDTPPIPFGEIFDVPRLRAALGIPILLWPEVKDEHSDFLDELGCWSVWDAVSTEDKFRDSEVPRLIHADVSYTKAPAYIKMEPNNPLDLHSSFWALATLSYPEGHAHSLHTTPRPSPLNQRHMPPDEHLLCFDYMYYVAAFRAHEYERDYSPAWNQVLKHMRWTDHLLNVTTRHVRQTLGVQHDEPTPPWISVHVRRRDFEGMCGDTPQSECFATLPIYARRVTEVRDELQRKGEDVKYVIMTSDERDPAWWAEVAALGWYRIDFEALHTEELYGKWYPTLIDAVIQSTGAGFVGTDHSTMSLIARRRTEDWSGGITRTVRWGWLGADDH